MEVESGTSNYTYSLNTLETSTHLTSVDGGAAVWQNNPASHNATIHIENGTGLTDFTNRDSWNDWNPLGEGNTGASGQRIATITPTPLTGLSNL